MNIYLKKKETNLTWSIEHNQQVVDFLNSFAEVTISQCYYTV